MAEKKPYKSIRNDNFPANVDKVEKVYKGKASKSKEKSKKVSKSHTV